MKIFFRFTYEQKITDKDLSLLISMPKKKNIRLYRVLSEDEVKQFLTLPDLATARGLRDRAILELLYSSGIRRSELIKLDLFDYNDTERSIRVFGKGRKERIVPVGRIAAAVIGNYLRDVRKHYAKTRALFVSLVNGKRLHPHSINLLFQQYCKLGQFRIRITPHVLRHSCATHMIRAGADIRYIQELLGHSSTKSTQIYTHLDLTDLKEAYRNSHPHARLNKTVSSGSNQ